MDNKPNIFELAWTWYEDYCFYLFFHKDKTEEDFKKDVETIIVKYGKEYIESETSWVGANNWISFIKDKMPEFGYEEVRQVQWEHFGDYIIKDEPDNQWKKIVGEELFNMALAKNKKIEDKIFNYGKQ